MFRSLKTGPAQTAPTLPHDERPHQCGMCRNPWGVSNPDCPNAPKRSEW